MYAKSEIELEPDAVKPYVDIVKAIPDEEYPAIFRNVVESKCRGKP